MPVWHVDSCAGRQRFLCGLCCGFARPGEAGRKKVKKDIEYLSKY
jgi:hypothetical protein